MNESSAPHGSSRIAKVLALVLAIAFLVVYVIYASGGFDSQDQEKEAARSSGIDVTDEPVMIGEVFMPSSKTISQPIFSVRFTPTPTPAAKAEPEVEAP